MPFRYEYLNVWPMALEYVDACFIVADGLPQRVQFSVGEQLRRSATSIIANIAEGSAKNTRRSERNFYDIARASLAETVGLIALCLRRRYLDDDRYQRLYNRANVISSMLNGLMKANQEPAIAETGEFYRTSNDDLDDFFVSSHHRPSPTDTFIASSPHASSPHASSPTDTFIASSPHASSPHASSPPMGVASSPHRLVASSIVHRPSSLVLVGIGPGDLAQLTRAAEEALRAAEVVVGYSLYLDLVRPLLHDEQEIFASPIGDELARARQAIELAAAGRRVALISSGDIGIYAMAGPVFEVLRERGWQGHSPEVEVLAGISAVQAAAARLGAPISHDFCTISLSDLLTPWELIERRVQAAAWGDFVVAFYNPRSRERDWQLAEALAIVREYRAADTPIALVRSVSRPGETIAVATLGEFDPAAVDMFTLVLIGNSRSYVVGGRMATPRGYTGEAMSGRGEEAKGEATSRRGDEATSGGGDEAKSKVTSREEAASDEYNRSSPHRLIASWPPDSLAHPLTPSPPHPTYPITLTNLRGLPVVLVGGGAVGERKLRGLLAAGASVRLISPVVTPGLRSLAASGAIEWEPRPYQPGDLDGARLVFTATNQRAVNRAVAEAAEALGLLCNVADDPQASSFHLPAVHRAEGVVVAVSTDGARPARAKRLRNRIAEWLAGHQAAQEEP
jgi:precorrin-3B C17-methyltransferase